MGTPGAKRTETAKQSAKAMAAQLSTVGPVTARGMFGGYGLSVDGVMFGLVNPSGVVHFRVDDTTRVPYEEAGGVAHGRMPYVSIPESILDDEARLDAWAEKALAIARAAKK